MNHIAPAAPFAAESRQSVTDLSAPLNFIERRDTKPVFHSAALTGGEMKYFFDFEAHTVLVACPR